jgi:predicted PurR-regulated permease PerM
MISSFMINFCGVFVSGFGTVFFNLIGAAYYRQNPSLHYLNLVMLILGSFCAIFGFIFILVIQCTLSVWYRSNQLINSQPNNNNELNGADGSFQFQDLHQTNNNQTTEAAAAEQQQQSRNCSQEQHQQQHFPQNHRIDSSSSSYVLNEYDRKQNSAKVNEMETTPPSLPSYKDLSINQNNN